MKDRTEEAVVVRGATGGIGRAVVGDETVWPSRKLPLRSSHLKVENLANPGLQEDPMKRSRFTEDQIFAILNEADAGSSRGLMCSNE